ncbi:hypothetical protein BHE74_00022786 [Ensete ventricosum]|nr:hypothetical protein BHE74_00022786 [Ensete ventricosum]
MPTLWGKSSSKDAKKKTVKENFIDTLHRFISSTEQKGSSKSRRIQRHSSDITTEKGYTSRAESRSTSPSKHVSRCQSFAGRPNAQPLPLPEMPSCITRTPSKVSISKPILEKRGKPQLHLPLPKPHRIMKGSDAANLDGDLATASVSSNCSIDSDDPGDSQLQSPVGNDFENNNRTVIDHHYRCIEDKLYIYLEYVSGGSIHKLLQEYGQFGEPAIRSYTQQILSGLAYLHAKNTVHRYD